MSKKYIVEGYWDCSSCGAKGIRGHLRECPNCGKPRGEDVQFYLKEFGEKYALDKNTSDKPDWLCDFCSSYNPDTAKQCLSCGAERESSSKDYSQIRETKKYSKINDLDNNGIDDSAQISEKERDKLNYQREREDREKKKQKYNKVSEQLPTKEEKPFFTKQIAIILALLTVVFSAVFYFFAPKDIELQVQSVAWERHVYIDRYTTVKEDGWDLPNNARAYDKRSEIHHYDKVFDHNEIYYEDVGKQEIDHYKTVSEKRDLGNGKFEITTHQEPVYKTVYHKEKRERPVYKDVPVYKLKYYYEIERWKHYRTVDTSGTDFEPYFGKYTLAEGEGKYKVGSERVGNKESRYTVTGLVNGKEVTYEVKDLDWWKTMKEGSTVNGTVINGSNVLSPPK